MSYIWVESPVERITRHSDNAEKRPGAGPAQEDSSRQTLLTAVAAHGVTTVAVLPSRTQTTIGHRSSGRNPVLLAICARNSGPTSSPGLVSRRYSLCQASVHPIRTNAAKSLFAFAEGQRLMRRRRPCQIVAGLPHRDRSSRQPHAEPALARLKSPPRELGHRPSLRAWTQRRPTNGRRLPAPGQKVSILAWRFPSILLPPLDIIASVC